MRIRTVKPEFWSDEFLSALPEATHTFAARLLNYVDDDGYFNANPKLIEAALFPLREPSRPIPVMLRELESVDWLRLAQGSDGRVYGWIVNFSKHQTINKHKPSKLAGLAEFPPPSRTPTVPIPDLYGLEQGTGNREQGDLDHVPEQERGDSVGAEPPDAGGGNGRQDQLAADAGTTRREQIAARSLMRDQVRKAWAEWGGRPERLVARWLDELAQLAVEHGPAIVAEEIRGESGKFGAQMKPANIVRRVEDRLRGEAWQFSPEAKPTEAQRKRKEREAEAAKDEDPLAGIKILGVVEGWDDAA